MRPVALTKDPQAMPHVCIKCGAHAQIREWFVDVGCEVEWEGIVYICNSCMADIVRVTPDFLSVEAHQEIVAEFRLRMEELTELKYQWNLLDEAWEDLTGLSIQGFIDSIVRVKEYGRGVELSRIVPSTTGDLPAIVSDSSEPECDNSQSDTTEPNVIAISF